MISTLKKRQDSLSKVILAVMWQQPLSFIVMVFTSAQ
ncbi:MAG: hypothetical protein [Escherichia phage RP3]|uniref:Uncharacterized protein n=1 Tax=Escherichia phage RP3 TaxID=2867296 RepID=A0ABY3TIZ5_9CAUD|nr:MAG: hypothetical protein [Escherichia phage RP3]